MALTKPDAAAERPKALSAGHRDRAALGISLVLVSTIFLAASDITSKHLTETLPALQIAWIRYVVFALVVVAAALWRQEGSPLRSRRPGLQLARGLGLVGSAIFFMSSLAYLPVADATAISFISPIFVTALSIPLLRETIGWRRWLAALVGLAGVLIIVRPGTDAFQFAALLPILGAFFWASSLIATRRLATTDSAATTMTYSALVGVLVLTCLVPFVWITPSWRDVALSVGVGLASTTGHWIVALAYRNAAASVLAPYSYTQIVWASLLGFLVFGVAPSGWTWAGASIIILSSIYTAHRERVRALEARRAAKGTAT